jgi:hypothetical protein
MPQLLDDITHAVARSTTGSLRQYVIEDEVEPLAIRGEGTERLRRPRLLDEPVGRQGGVFQVAPVPGGTYSDDWGAPRVGHTHQGNDIFAPPGTPIYASFDGVVTHGSGGIAGNYYYLVGKQGYIFGAHLSKFGKKGRVRAGEVIGYVGDTGNAKGTSPHLHFEWHPGGKSPGDTAAINPFKLLNDVYGDPQATPSDVAERRATGGKDQGPLTRRQMKEQDIQVRPESEPKPTEQVAQEVARPFTWEDYVPRTYDSIMPTAVVDSLLPVTFRDSETNRRVAAPKNLGGWQSQVYAGFMDAGRPDLARMVGTKEFTTWVNAESGGNPRRVSGPINQGLRNGGLFQFWFGHDWAEEFYNGKVYTQSAYEQAQSVVKYFDLTPADIRRYAASIRAGTYGGWG